MTIERLEELKEWFHDIAGRLVSTFHAENCYLIDYLIEAEIDRQSVTFNDDMTREKMVAKKPIKDSINPDKTQQYSCPNCGRLWWEWKR